MLGIIKKGIKKYRKRSSSDSPEKKEKIYQRKERKKRKAVQKKRKKKSSSRSGAINYILISSKSDKEHDLFNKLKEESDIIEIHPLFGEYDLIAKVGIPVGEKLNNYVAKIRGMEEVDDTKTLTGIKF